MSIILYHLQEEAQPLTEATQDTAQLLKGLQKLAAGPQRPYASFDVGSLIDVTERLMARARRANPEALLDVQVGAGVCK